MSAKLFGKGLEAQMPSHGTKLVLLKLLDACDPDGTRIFPGIASISRAAMCSNRQVQRVMRLFTAAGLLVMVRAGGNGPGDTAEYRLDLALFDRLHADGWDQVFGPVGTALKGSSVGDGVKGDVASPLAKGDVGAAKGDISANKGDAQMSPDPSIDPLLDPSERKNGRAGAHDHPVDVDNPTGAETDQPETEQPISQRDQKRAELEDAFKLAWPTSAADNQNRTDKALAALSDDVLETAVNRIGDFVAFCKTNRRHLCAGYTYAEERRWTRLPRAGAAAPGGSGSAQMVPCWSLPFWGIIRRDLADGKSSKVAIMVNYALRAGSKFWTVAAGEVPSEAETADLVRVVTDTEQWAAWSDWFKQRSINFGTFNAPVTCWLPNQWPPGHGQVQAAGDGSAATNAELRQMAEDG